MDWVDISAPISDAIKSYIPGVVYAQVEPIFTLERDGVESDQITLSTLSGTYFETARHVRTDAPTVDQVPLEAFVGPALLLDVGVKGAAQAISVDDLEPYANELRAGDAALVKTGWSSRFGTAGYFDESPYFRPEALEWLLAKKIRILGGDFPSFDNRKAPQGLIKRLFADPSVYLLAPLVNMAAVERRRVTLFALPLNVVGVSGAPARVLVYQGEGPL